MRSMIAQTVQAGAPEVRARLQRSEQYRTFSQSFAHFFRQVNGRPHVAQSLVGRSPLRRIRPDMDQKVGVKDYVMAARGKDSFGNFVHAPAPDALFAPEALDLYEEIRTEQSKTMMKGATKTNAMYS